MQTKFEISVHVNRVVVKMISMSIILTGYAGVEKQNQLYRKETVSVLQNLFRLAKEENATVLPLRQYSCVDQILTFVPDRYSIDSK